MIGCHHQHSNYFEVHILPRLIKETGKEGRNEEGKEGEERREEGKAIGRLFIRILIDLIILIRP